jgi:hypothetical protein
VGRQTGVAGATETQREKGDAGAEVRRREMDGTVGGREVGGVCSSAGETTTTLYSPRLVLTWSSAAFELTFACLLLSGSQVSFTTPIANVIG